ncbi:hypothetical protein HK104_005684, partial [Borealophlyctis nickersoniae]
MFQTKDEVTILPVEKGNKPCDEVTILPVEKGNKPCNDSVILAAPVAEVRVNANAGIGSVVDAYTKLTGRKPVIYRKPVITMYSDTPISAAVTISLDPTYSEFSYLYPASSKPIPIATTTHRWEVTNVSPTGTLTVPTHGETTYLFWESHTTTTTTGKPATPIVPFDTHSFTLTHAQFVPTFLTLLQAFGFGTKETDDFITYWHPQVIGWERGCLVRVLTMDEYASVAELSVVPVPDTVVRVFVQFGRREGAVEGVVKGVEEVVVEDE